MKYDDKRLSPSRRGYGRDWQRLRAVHLAEEPLCRMCQQMGRTTAAAVVDHIITIQDDPTLRLDRSNLQSLCATCHSGAKQRQDKGAGVIGADVNGVPLDPSHHWRRGG